MKRCSLVNPRYFKDVLSWGKLWICVPSGSKDPSPSGCAVSWRPAGFAETRRIFSLPMAVPAEPWKYLLIERKRWDKWGYFMLHHVTSGNWWVKPLHGLPATFVTWWEWNDQMINSSDNEKRLVGSVRPNLESSGIKFQFIGVKYHFKCFKC